MFLRPRCLLIYCVSDSGHTMEVYGTRLCTENHLNFPLRVKVAEYAFHLIAIVASIDSLHLGRISSSSCLIKISMIPKMFVMVVLLGALSDCLL